MMWSPSSRRPRRGILCELGEREECQLKRTWLLTRRLESPYYHLGHYYDTLEHSSPESEWVKRQLRLTR